MYNYKMLIEEVKESLTKRDALCSQAGNSIQ